MKSRVRVFSVVVIFALFNSFVFAGNGRAKDVEIVKPRAYEALRMTESPALKAMLDSIVGELLRRGGEKPFKPEEVAVTLIDLTDPSNVQAANVRGDAAIYPASVVKMFYMAALQQQLEDRKITMTKELERGLRDMIVDSSNEATQYIVDVLTDTSSGGEMPKKEFEKWSYRRNRMNRYFSSMGYTNINVNQKTHCEDAYGVEQQFRNYKGENRNMITTDASARLIAEIALGRSVNPERSRIMMGLLARDPFAEPTAANSQAVGFSGKALIDKKLTGAKLWSKAGWTSRSRHDAAYVELPDGRKFAVAIFTENHANDTEALPSIVGSIIVRLRK
jgi:hypothetical protein